MQLKNMLWLVFVTISLLSCKQKKAHEIPVAKVFDDYLYKSDLVNVIPKGITSKDSVLIAKNYIQNWITQTLLVHKAKENLSSEKLDFDQQIEDYKRSLIIYEYQKEYLNQTQNQDTTVKEDEIDEYYKNNKASLTLENTMIKYNFIFLKKKAKNLVSIWTIFSKQDSISRNSLKKMCQESADKFSFTQEWISLNDLNKIVPTKITNPENYFKTNKTIEASDKDMYYLINVFNYGIANNTAPLELVKEKIKAIIINKRRQERIEKMEEQIYNNAKSQNNIKLY